MGGGYGAGQPPAGSPAPCPPATSLGDVPASPGGRKAIGPRLVPLVLCQAGGTNRDIIRLKWR